MFVHPHFSAGRRAAALAFLLVLALGGCGRYGPLEPPPDAATQAKPAMPKPDTVNAESLTPMMKPKIPPITPPNQPFFLDFLLK